MRAGAGDQPVGGRAGEQLAGLAAHALGGDREPAVLDQAARVDEVGEVLARRARAGCVAALDRLRPRVVAGQPPALEHLGEVVSNAVLSHGGRLAYAVTVGLAVTNATLEGVAVGLRCEDGTIAELGPGVEPKEGDESLDARRDGPRPGLVNAHTHAAMTLFRGYADDLPLMEWLTETHLAGREAAGRRGHYWGTRLACVEMIRTGTTSFWDMYWRAEATARAVEDAGVRAVAGSPLIDDGDPAKSERACADAERSLAAGRRGRRRAARPGFAPHAIYSLSERSLRWIAERANELKVPVQIHLSETEDEVKGSMAEHGKRPAFYLDESGCSARGRCSRTAAGSTAPSSS